MAVDTSKSEIIEFYRDKNVLITGASGFLGRLLVEKLLRLCDPGKLYILVRTKKGTSPKDRVQSLFQVPLFDKLRSIKPNFMEHIELVEGDVSFPGLGIKDQMRTKLIENVDVVLHGAATVNFDEPLKKATAINVCGTRDITNLCKEMKNLKAFVHVSTAFCHCPRKEIDEVFYDAPLSADNLIRLAECLREEQLNDITKTIMAEWPNTYAFTKAVAEDAIKTHATGLPVSVLRPAIVISTLNDPIEGWIDNLYGPSGIVAGCAAGLLRVAWIDSDARADFVPADLVVNGIMAAGFKTATEGPVNDIPIFNLTTARDNPLTYGNFHKIIRAVGAEIPPMQAVWYLTITEVKTKFWFTILTFLFHVLPAFIIDTVLVILQKKPQVMKIYKKIHKFVDVLSYFATRSWFFHNNNLNNLLNGLNKTDQELFNFDMSKLKWDQMIRVNALGIRQYIMHEDNSNIPAAKRKMFFLHILHRFMQLIIFGVVGWFTLSLVTPIFHSLVHLTV